MGTECAVLKRGFGMLYHAPREVLKHATFRALKHQSKLEQVLGNWGFGMLLHAPREVLKHAIFRALKHQRQARASTGKLGGIGQGLTPRLGLVTHKDTDTEPESLSLPAGTCIGT